VFTAEIQFILSLTPKFSKLSENNLNASVKVSATGGLYQNIQQALEDVKNAIEADVRRQLPELNDNRRLNFVTSRNSVGTLSDPQNCTFSKTFNVDVKYSTAFTTSLPWRLIVSLPLNKDWGFTFNPTDNPGGVTLRGNYDKVVSSSTLTIVNFNV